MKRCNYSIITSALHGPNVVALGPLEAMLARNEL